jgi:hypothetical protein
MTIEENDVSHNRQQPRTPGIAPSATFHAERSIHHRRSIRDPKTRRRSQSTLSVARWPDKFAFGH